MPLISLQISHVLPKGEIYKGMHDAEFMIFLFHYPLIRFYDALADNLYVPITEGEIIFKYATVLFLVLLTIHRFHFIIKKYFAKCYSYIYGKN